MNYLQKKQMEQFRNRDTGNFHIYRDQKGEIFYLVSDVDDASGMFISAETPDGQLAKKIIREFAVMKHIQDLSYNQPTNGTKTNSEQTTIRETKTVKSKRYEWGCAVIILLIFFAIIYLTVQNSKNKKTEPYAEINNDKLHSQYDDIVWKDYNRVIGLLSVKYSFSDSIVKGIILEYLRINEPLKYSHLTLYDENRDTSIVNNTFKPKESIDVTILSLNKQYGIREDTISDILLDFEIWFQVKEK
jgi:hypothetical protein